jgi:hypothetical protein
VTNRRVSVTVDADVNPFVRGLTTAGIAAKTFSSQLESADSRLANIVQTGLALAPALVPLGAAAVPALAGLTTQLGFAAGAAGVSLLAFQGVGDALGALNDYQLEPSAENFAKMREEMATLGPAGREFVRILQDARPELQRLQDVAQAGMFPEAADGLEDLLSVMPRFERVVGSMAEAVGDLFAEAGDNLADPRWLDFFTYLETEAQPIIGDMGRSLGNFFEGFTNGVMAFDPLTQMFSDGMLEASRSFREWTDGLDRNDSFIEFVDYIRTNTPQALDTLGALGDALVDFVKAAAPVGAASLPIIEALAEGLSAIAESPVGPVLVTTAAAVGTLGRSMALLRAVGITGQSSLFSRIFAVDKIKAGAAAMVTVTSAQERATMSTAALASAEAKRQATFRAGFGQLGRNSLALGGLAIALSGVAEGTEVSNAAMYAMMGSLAGPWGAAIGGGVGLAMDFAAANDDLEAAITRAQAALDSGDTSQMRKELRLLRAEIQATDEKLTLDTWTDWLGALSPAVGVLTGQTGAAVNEMLTGTQEKARETRAELKAALSGTDGDIRTMLVAPLGDSARAFEVASMSADDFTASLAKLNRVLEGRANLRDYEAALDDFTAGLKENGRTMDITTAKGRENEANLDNIATTALKVAENMRGTQRVEVLSRARGDILDMIGRLDLSGGALRRAMRLIRELDKAGAKPKIDADDKPFKGKTNNAKRDLKDLDGKKANAKIDAEDKPARAKLNAVEKLLNGINRKSAKPKVDADTRQAESAFAALFRTGTRLDNLRPKPKAALETKQAEGAFADMFRAGSKLDAMRPNPRVTADTGQAMGALGGVRSELSRIVSKSITVTVNRVNRGVSNLLGGFSQGGYTGDVDPREVAGVVHGREFVVNARATASHRAILEKINASVPGYAGGGFVVPRSPVASRQGSSDDGAVRRVDELGRAAGQSANGLVAEAKIRKRMLERRGAALEKELEASKSKLDAIKAERDAIVAGVKARLSEGSVFDGRSTVEMEKPENFAELSPEQQKAWYDAQWSVQSSLSRTPEQIMLARQADAERMLELIKQLEANGLNGNALGALLQEGDMTQIAGYAQDKAAGRRYERIYNQTARVIDQTSAAAGGASFGRAVREQAVEVRGLRKDVRENSAAQRKAEKRLEAAMDRAAKAAAKDGPDRIIAGTNRKIANANRGRRT